MTTATGARKSSIDGPGTREVVRVENLTKTFRRGDGITVKAVSNTSLEVKNGEFVVLLGPSGCGKTTLLRCIAGLESPDQGLIEIFGKTAYSSSKGVDVPPERRELSMIFQSYALWPHMTAFKNVAYPLQCKRGRQSRSAVAEQVHRILNVMGIGELADQYPNQMSGGQQQRVALARSLVGGNNLVLFDEPLSNVDAKVREQLRLEMLEMQRQLGFAALYVTHDQVEAMQLGHRAAVLSGGEILQIGSPRDIYQRPRCEYVASFVGTSNAISGKVASISGGEVRVSTACGHFVAPADRAHEVRINQKAKVVWRPESGCLSTPSDARENALRGTIKASAFMGSHIEHVFDVGGASVMVWTTGDVPHPGGALMEVRLKPGELNVYPADEADPADVPSADCALVSH